MSSELNLSNTSYTNKDFQSVYPELLQLAKDMSFNWDPTVSNESDPGVVLIKELALAIDKINYNSDKNALENYPSTVSQDRTFREIFNLLGYFPRWYESSKVSIVFQWRGDEPDNTDITPTITLPLWTEIRDTESNYTYTVVDTQPVISKNGVVTQSYVALEGTLKQLKINNNSVISVNNLDENNRIYLPDYAVAQNGIYISNINDDGIVTQNWWTQVENLETEPVNSYIYSFGIDVLTNQCYVEFPTDVYNLIDSGINIFYIVSNGSQGNVPTGVLNTLKETTLNCVTNTGATEAVSTENIYVSNTGTISFGKNPETINEAYRNYKKKIGTFDTLVTLRDYNNAIYNTEQVSNVVVSDRTNDIQNSYKVMTTGSDLNNYEIVEEEKDSIEINGKTISIPKMEPFDLKIYAMQYSSVNSSKQEYDKSFEMYVDTDPNELGSKLWTLTQLLNQNKCISHDFNSLDKNKMCLLRNKYTIKCKIIPTMVLTALQQSSVKQNISQALYSNFNARNVDFGSELDYELLQKTVQNADNRIKTVILDTPNMDTYAWYLDDNGVFKDICISDEHSDYISGYYDGTSFYESYAKSPFVVASNATTEEAVLTVDFNKFISAIGNASFALTLVIFEKKNDEWTLEDNVIALSDYGITLKESATATQLQFSYKYVQNFINVLTGNSISTSFKYLDLLSGNVYSYTGSGFELYSDMRNTFRREILAKSILAGVTPYLTSEGPEYKYQLDQVGKTFNDVDHISTDTTMTIELGASPPEYVLKDNETLQFYRPNLIDGTVYGSYVKYELVSTNAALSIPANSIYQLKTGETLTFLYKDDDASEVYHVTRYGKGTIISPSFTLSNPQSVSRFSSAYNTSENTYLSVRQSEQVENNYDIAQLTAANQITIKERAVVTLQDSVNYCYWVTNKTINQNGSDRYVLLLNKINDSYGEYVLGSNEYFLHTNRLKSSFEIVGAGAAIRYYTPEWANMSTTTLSVPAVSITDIGISGSNALTDYWFEFNGVKNTKYLEIIEQEFVNVAPTGTVELNYPSMPIQSDTKVQFTKDGFKANDAFEAHNEIPYDGIAIVANPGFDKFFSVSTGYGYGEFKTGNERSLSVELDLTTQIQSFTVTNISASNRFNADDFSFITPDEGADGKLVCWLKLHSILPNYTGDADGETFTFTYSAVNGVWSLRYQSEETVLATFDTTQLIDNHVFGFKYTGTETFMNDDKIFLVFASQTPVYVLSFINYNGYETAILYGQGGGTDITRFGTYYTITPSPTTEGEVITLEYVYRTAGDITLSGFNINYLEPDGTSGLLLNNITEEFAWKARAFVTLDCSVDNIETIYPNQKIWIGDEEPPVGDDRWILPETSLSDPDRYIMSSEAVYIEGGSNASTALLNSYGEIYYPSFYAITNKMSTPEAENIVTDCPINTGLLTIKLQKNKQQHSVVYNTELDNAKYVFRIKNDCSDLTSFTISYYIKDGATETLFRKFVDFSNRTNFAPSGIYYINLDLTDIPEGSDGIVKIEITRTGSDEENIQIYSLIRYQKNKETDNFENFDLYLKQLNVDNLFDFTYRVPDSKLIENPLASESFFIDNHILNKYTIPQIGTLNTKIME